jgi:hypothetical protein
LKSQQDQDLDTIKTVQDERDKLRAASTAARPKIVEARSLAFEKWDSSQVNAHMSDIYALLSQALSTLNPKEPTP